MNSENRFTEINFLHEAGLQFDAIVGRVANELQPPLKTKPNHAYVCIDLITLEEASKWSGALKEGDYPCYPLRMNFASKDLFRLVDGVFTNIIFDKSVVNRMLREDVWASIFEWYRLLEFGGRLWIRNAVNMLDLDEYRKALYAQGKFFKDDEYFELSRQIFKDKLAEIGLAAGFTRFYEGISSDGKYPIEHHSDRNYGDFPYYVLEK